MHFTEPTRAAGTRPWQRRLHWLARGKAALVAALLAGCSSPMPPYRPTPVSPQPGDAVRPTAPRENTAPPAAATPATTAISATTAKGLKPPMVVGSWSAYRRQVAERLVAASPGATYTGTVPDVLLAIPVLEVELHADGSVRKVQVLRHPKQATDTTQLAIDAVHRAAPYGDVSRLPRPWKFAETFLFDDARRFKPRTLDD